MCKITLTSSSLNSFCSCRRQYDYKINKHISPVEMPKSYDNSVALSKAVTSLAKSFNDGLPLDDALVRGVEIISTYGLDEAGSAQVEAAFRAYAARYYNVDNDKWQVVDSSVNACVEVPLSPNVIYRTYIDYVAYKDQGKYFLVVNKSSSTAITDDFLTKFFIDNDIRMQVMAAQQLLGVEITGVIINTMTRPQHKIRVGETDAEYAERNAARKGKADLKRKVGETREEYIQRMVDEYPKESLRKFFITFSDAQLNTAASNILAIASDIMSCKSFYPNTCECSKYGKCPYMNLCKFDGDLSKCSDSYEIKADK